MKTSYYDIVMNTNLPISSEMKDDLKVVYGMEFPLVYDVKDGDKSIRIIIQDTQEHN